MNGPSVEGRIESDGRIFCPRGHWVGAADEKTFQGYCNSCKVGVYVALPSKAFLANKLLDSLNLVARLVSDLPPD